MSLSYHTGPALIAAKVDPVCLERHRHSEGREGRGEGRGGPRGERRGGEGRGGEGRGGEGRGGEGILPGEWLATCHVHTSYVDQVLTFWGTRTFCL